MSLKSLPQNDNLDPSADAAGSEVVKFFDTSHLKADIKGHSIRGGAVTVGAQAVKIILQTGSTAILARLLTPADFGLIAMVSVFTQFVNLFKDLGLSTATIQRKDITHQQVSTLFWVNITVSCLLILIVALISPLVALFYNEPRLTLVTIAIGGTFIFGGLIAQHTALMRRQMRFRSLAVIEIISMATGITAAVISAFFGLSYWSLVIMMVAKGIVNVILIWKKSPWRPSFPTRGSGVRPMLAFGGSLTGSNVLSYLTHNADNFIIGYALGSTSLGFYTKAYALITLPMSQFSAPLRTIMIPALSRLQTEPKRYRRFFLQVLAAISMIIMPLITFLVFSADEIVDILLGSQWKTVSITFRYLGPAAFLSAIGYAQGWLFISLGRAGVAFRWNMLTAPLIIIGFIIGIHWGINGVAVSFSITYSILIVLGLLVACRKSPVRFYDVVVSLAVPVLSSLLAALVAALVRSFILELNIFVRLVICALVFAVSYFICVMATPAGRRNIHSMINALSSLRRESADTVE